MPESFCVVLKKSRDVPIICTMISPWEISERTKIGEGLPHCLKLLCRSIFAAHLRNSYLNGLHVIICSMKMLRWNEDASVDKR